MLEQTITTFELISLIGVIVTIIGGLYAIFSTIRLERRRFATKEYVEQEIDVIEERIKSVEKEQTSTSEHLLYIRGRLDDFIDNHN